MQNGRPSRQLTPSMFFFGPESERPVQEVREPMLRPGSSHRAASPEPTSIRVPQKHPRELGPNGMGETTPQPAVKRSRKTANPVGERNGARKTSAPPMVPPGSTSVDVDAVNGHMAVQNIQSPPAVERMEENGIVVNGIHPEDHMDVDTDGEPQPDSAVDVIPPPIATLSSGPSIGVQVTPAKVANLIPSTIILETLNDKQLAQSAWSPHDHSILTSRGDTTCGIWRPYNSFGRPAFQELLSYRDGQESLVTALAWEPTGSVLAVATCTQGIGELHLFDGRSLDLLETLPASQRAIVQLKFQKAGFRLLGLAPYEDDSAASSILMWDVSNNGQTPAEPLSIQVPETLEDIDCALFEGNGIACAVGGKAAYQLRALSDLQVEIKYSSVRVGGNDRWAFVKCSWRNANDSLLVTASSESGRIWLPSTRDLAVDAHQAPITGLQIRPAPAVGPGQLSTSEFATSSEDGSIKVWKVNHGNSTIDQVIKLGFGRPVMVKALSYSPDGFCLAGSCDDSVRIWNAEHVYNAMATWQSSNDWKGNNVKDEEMMSNGAMSSINGDAAGSTTDHSLTWDLDSKKLAFGLGSQVRYFNINL